MKYETVKSIVLTMLVIISALLTWSLWTYQPQDEFIDKNNVHEISIADKRDAADLIKPIRVLFHLNGEDYGTVSDNHINKLIKNIGTWNFYDIGGAQVLESAHIQESLHSDNRIEIMYPDAVPFELYKGIIQVEAEDVPSGSFNRIVINLTNDSKEGASVYFVSTDTERVYESHVNPERIANLVVEINSFKHKYDRYESYEIPNGQLYLPTKEKELAKYKYYTDYIDPERFKNALFRDPSKVRRDFLTNGERFTDDTSLMNVDHLTNMLFYVNPGQEMGMSDADDRTQVLKKSIDFVNEHDGWTDNYRYFNMSDYEQKTVFQLFVRGYPVFNDLGMTEIHQNWGSEEIYQYKRPYFSIDIPLPGQTKVILPTGKEVLDYLLSDKEFKANQLQDLLIGYRLSKDSTNAKVIVLEPSWYYQYAGTWLRVDPADMRGNVNGLE